MDSSGLAARDFYRGAGHIGRHATIEHRLPHIDEPYQRLRAYGCGGLQAVHSQFIDILTVQRRPLIRFTRHEA